ncbi:hypothetical protein PPYC1_11655 [Paenibacillus polymyxa]|uniref:hypothetical protein n=1 Tax=Paenibacillus polymyxa TaxID=1406 RepID=UPI0008FCB535|nr:hypothetical protein [Paenibacillus polymyxa]APB70975.1 hypothetical protein PPYC1_11655 [Paenibacillus polymyxa]
MSTEASAVRHDGYAYLNWFRVLHFEIHRRQQSLRASMVPPLNLNANTHTVIRLLHRVAAVLAVAVTMHTDDGKGRIHHPSSR